MSAPVVAVLNLKGGVGKTTVSAAVGRGLFEASMRSVVMIDLDPQFNLTQALQSEEDYAAFEKAGKTVMSAFEPPPRPRDLFRTTISNAPSPPAKAIEKVLRHYLRDKSKRLSLIMGDFELVKFSLIADQEELESAKQRFLNFIAITREEYDLVILDCNPSSSFLTSCAIEAATDILVPVNPDKFSLLGLRLLDRYVQRLKLARRPRIHPILNAVSRTQLTESERILRGSEFRQATLRAELYKSKLLIATPGFHGFAVDRRLPNKEKVRVNVASICTELSRKIGL